MRISDWSSDVCSSDLIRLWPLLLLVGLANSGTAVAEEGRRWTLEDVVTVPAEFELSLASDGKSLAYLERRADLQKNETVSILHLLDRKSTRLNSSHECAYRMPSSA